MKHFAIIAAVLLAFCVYTSLAQSHNQLWGYVGPYDQLLSREIIIQKYKFLRVTSQDYEYPPKGHINYDNITGIRCTDQYVNGNGGYATLVKGGPGHRNVTIHLKTQRNHGYNFIIEIYGRPKQM